MASGTTDAIEGTEHGAGTATTTCSAARRSVFCGRTVTARGRVARVVKPSTGAGARGGATSAISPPVLAGLAISGAHEAGNEGVRDVGIPRRVTSRPVAAPSATAVTASSGRGRSAVVADGPTVATKVGSGATLVTPRFGKLW